MDRERLEKITAPAGETPSLSDEDVRLRDAWLALGRAVDAPGEVAWTIDPDDVFVDVNRRERRRRRELWRNTAVLAASILLMAGAISLALWKGGRAAPAMANAGPLPAASLVWEDDWDSSADALFAEVAVANESLHQPAEAAWIDRRIQSMFEECFRLWATL